MTRKKRMLLLIGGIVFGCVAGIVWIVLSRPSNRTPPSFGSPIEEFTLKDLQGRNVSLSDFRGKPVVINFWLTSCEPCVREMPLLLSYYQRYATELVVLGINSGDSQGSIVRFLEEHPVDFPILLDVGGEVMQKYYVRGYPSTFFVDSDGVLRAQHIGELSENLLLSYLAKIGIAP